MHEDEQAFLDGILANPTDLQLRQVYADWLEERGDRRAEYLRLDTSFERINFVDWRPDSLDYYVEHYPEVRQAVQARRAIDELQGKMRGK